MGAGTAHSGEWRQRRAARAARGGMPIAGRCGAPALSFLGVQALGMGVHESQSLLWERLVGLGRPFSAYLLPLMKEYFPQVRVSAGWLGSWVAA